MIRDHIHKTLVSHPLNIPLPMRLILIMGLDVIYSKILNTSTLVKEKYHLKYLKNLFRQVLRKAIISLFS